MKTVAYLICLLLVLLSGTTPSDGPSLHGTAADYSLLHFEKNKRHLPESTAHFHLPVTDETNDNADSETEDADPSHKEAAVVPVPWYHLYTFDRLCGSRAQVLYAKAAPFILKSTHKYIEQQVLRI